MKLLMFITMTGANAFKTRLYKFYLLFAILYNLTRTVKLLCTLLNIKALNIEVTLFIYQ